MIFRYLYVTLGHTAAGKTSLSRFLLMNEKIKFEYIAEGEIKRSLVSDYSTKDSLNENLRDQAYNKAIKEAQKHLYKTDVLIDASFHRLNRRQMVYEMLQNKLDNVQVIWLYCYCTNIDKIEDRIKRRKKQRKTATTQADSMEIYKHIISGFDYPLISEIPISICGAIIYIDSDKNVIDRIEYNNAQPSLRKKVEELREIIDRYLSVWRKMS